MDIEKKLSEEKLNNIQVPSDFEQRLTTKLMDHETHKKKNYKWVSLISLAAALLLLVGVNFNGVAYYSKLLVGYDQLLSEYDSGAMKEENGQYINKSEVIDGELTVTVDKIVTDANRTILFLKLQGNEEFTEDVAFNWLSFARIEGFMTDVYMHSSISEWKEEENALYSVMTFGTINGFAKELRLILRNGFLDVPKEATITFDYNSNKALQTVYKEKINKKFNLVEGYIHFDTIRGSSISTYLEGKIKLPKEIKLGTPHIDLTDIQIIVNGKVLESTGGSISNRTGVNEFTIRAEGLPNEIDSLIIAVPSFANYKQLDLTLSNEHNKTEEGITIEKISQDTANTYVTLSTSEDVLLDGVSVVSTNGNKTSLERTIDTEEKGNIKTRTLVFPTTEEIQSIHVKGMFYKHVYNYELPLK